MVFMIGVEDVSVTDASSRQFALCSKDTSSKDTSSKDTSSKDTTKTCP